MTDRDKARWYWKLRNLWHRPAFRLAYDNSWVVKFWAWQPFCCKDDAGRWQTQLCNWLEDQARHYEDQVLLNDYGFIHRHSFPYGEPRPFEHNVPKCPKCNSEHIWNWVPYDSFATVDEVDESKHYSECSNCGHTFNQ